MMALGFMLEDLKEIFQYEVVNGYKNRPGRCICQSPVDL